jgi:hypothetical protein
MKSLVFLSTIDSENPNSMIMQFFFQGKSTEIVKISATPILIRKAVREIF